MSVVCFVMYDLSIVGGVERVVEGLANRLVENYNIYIVSLHGNRLNPALRFDNRIKTDFLRLEDTRLRKQMVSGTKKLAGFFRENKIDVAFLEATYCGFIGAPLRYFSRTKIVFCDHGALLNQWNEKDIRMMRRVASFAADKIVVLTQKSKADYIKLFNVKERKITNIYNWINESYLDEKRQYDLESKTIVTAGRFTKEKGFDLLVEVAKDVLPYHEDWKWYIYGDGPLKDDIQKKIVEAGLEDSVILKGFTSDIAGVLEHSALYVLPSYREGVPLVLLEAKAFKIPSISFDILTGPNEIIVDGVNGFLVERYDTKAMAERIKELLSDSNQRKQLSENAYSNIEPFREETVFSQWVTLINNLMLR